MHRYKYIYIDHCRSEFAEGFFSISTAKCYGGLEIQFDGHQHRRPRKVSEDLGECVRPPGESAESAAPQELKVSICFKR